MKSEGGGGDNMMIITPDQVASFRRRYNTLQPRGPLLLLSTQDDERGVQVPVTSLVVVSPQPHPQLLNLQQAATTLSDLLTYIPPSQLPPTITSVVRSADVVCKSQQGSSVELGLVFTSILLGAGYNALVVQGEATHSLVTRDTSHLTCPYLPQQSEEGARGPETVPSKYSIRPPPDLTSRYTAIMQERSRRQQQQQQKNEGNNSGSTGKQKKKKKKQFDLTDETLWVPLIPPSSPSLPLSAHDHQGLPKQQQQHQHQDFTYKFPKVIISQEGSVIIVFNAS
ncbi:hypothetical protein Pcinc_001729 [Petrolisthes cinctipes]|uniref:Uncharacterized protein n=1 Tax=Petrolisthes cinctipes TaxID=88211 RepID=A0AAE1L3M2_PETCI|nr:hypothetical protein Pcinc_001729 [Petrolisthes cinctipes]